MVNDLVVRATRNTKSMGGNYNDETTFDIDGLFNLALDDTVSIRFEYASNNNQSIAAQPLYSTFEVQRVSDTPA